MNTLKLFLQTLLLTVIIGMITVLLGLTISVQLLITSEIGSFDQNLIASTPSVVALIIWIIIMFILFISATSIITLPLVLKCNADPKNKYNYLLVWVGAVILAGSLAIVLLNYYMEK
jgi:hypothetical protein